MAHKKWLEFRKKKERRKRGREGERKEEKRKEGSPLVFPGASESPVENALNSVNPEQHLISQCMQICNH
jgi:hypothetical protein